MSAARQAVRADVVDERALQRQGAVARGRQIAGRAVAVELTCADEGIKLITKLFRGALCRDSRTRGRAADGS